MNDDAFKRALEAYEKLAEKCPEIIDDILPEINELIALKSQYDADIVKKKYDTEIVKKECEEKTKQAESFSEMMQALWQVELQMKMHSLCSPPVNKPSQIPQIPEPEVSDESASTSLPHSEEFH